MMTPAQLMMQKMLMEQQQQLQQNPIGQGTLLGMQAAKQSIQMDEADKNRAMGLGAFNMFSNMGNQNLKYGQRPRDVFQQFSHALPHGVNAYLGEEERAKKLNAQLLARQMEQEQKRRHEQLLLSKMQYEMERAHAKEAEDRAYNKRYLDIMAGRGRGDTLTSEQEKGLFQGIPEGDVPLKLLGKTERANAVKDMIEMTKAGKPAMHLVKEANALMDILDKYPELSTDLSRAWKPGASKEPSPGDLVRLKSMDQKKRTALDKGEKIIQDLLVSQVKSMKGTSTTDIIKQAIASALPHMGNTAEANKYILKNVVEEFSDTADQARRAQKGLAGQYYTPRRTPEIEESKVDQEIAELERESAPRLESQPSIAELREQFPNSQSLSDEELLRWHKEKNKRGAQ